MRSSRITAEISGRPAGKADTRVPDDGSQPAPSASALHTSRQRRHGLIRKIETARKSRVLTYVCSDRPGLLAQIGDDAIRPMYDVVRALGKVDRLDLFLHSRGGAVEVPWRIVSMLREHCRLLGALVPFRAHSAATMIALGCDEIVMGPKAELGPIDAAVKKRTANSDGTTTEEDILVEDVMSYVSFLKAQVGLASDDVLAEQMRVLSEWLSPPLLGKVYRTHTHIRLVATRMLTGRAEPGDEEQVGRIVDALAERRYSHDDTITRRDAKVLGLPVRAPDPGVDAAMWGLLEEYERLLSLRRPVDADEILGTARDEADVPATSAIIEAREMVWVYRGMLNIRRIRQVPSQLNFNINLALPGGVAPGGVPAEVINELSKQIRNDLPGAVRAQSAVLRVDTRLQNARWRNVTLEDA